MTQPTKSQLSKEDLPRNLTELLGLGMRQFGFAAVLAAFIFVQWKADQDRTARLESILLSNAEVLRSNSIVMEKLGNEWRQHEATAKEFISDLTRDIADIKNNIHK